MAATSDKVTNNSKNFFLTDREKLYDFVRKNPRERALYQVTLILEKYKNPESKYYQAGFSQEEINARADNYDLFKALYFAMSEKDYNPDQVETQLLNLINGTRNTVPDRDSAAKLFAVIGKYLPKRMQKNYSETLGVRIDNEVQTPQQTTTNQQSSWSRFFQQLPNLFDTDSTNQASKPNWKM